MEIGVNENSRRKGCKHIHLSTNVIVIEGFNECVLFSAMGTRFIYKGGWMETQDNMEGAKALESVDIVNQHTHYELTNVIDVDVTPIGKGLDKAD